MSISPGRRLVIEVSFLLLLVTLFLLLATGYFPFQKYYEDCFIAFRYAANLAQGAGFVWNVGGPPEQGVTGLAWTLILAGVASVFERTPAETAVYLSFGFSVACILVAYLSARLLLPDERRAFAFIAPVLLVMNPFFIRHAGSGLETSLAHLGIAVTCLLAAAQSRIEDTRWYGLAVAMTVLAFAIRPDLALLPGSVFGLLCIVRAETVAGAIKNVAIRYGLPLFLAMAVYWAIVNSYFGYFLPLSVHLKILSVENLMNAERGGILRFILSNQASFLTVSSPMVLVIAIGLLVRRSTIKPEAVVLALSAFAFYAYLFTVVPIVNFGLRFQSPIFVILSVIVPYAIHTIAALAERHSPLRWPHLAIVFGVVSLGMTGHFTSQRNSAEAEQNRDHHEAQKISSALAGIPGLSIASTEAGQLAYFSRARFLDLVGLNSRFVAFNKNTPDYSANLRAYLHDEFGMPDIYHRPGRLGTLRGSGPYAYLETHLEIASLYRCWAVEGDTTLCLRKTMDGYEKVKEALAAAGVALEQPYRF